MENKSQKKQLYNVSQYHTNTHTVLDSERLM